MGRENRTQKNEPLAMILTLYRKLYAVRSAPQLEGPLVYRLVRPLVSRLELPLTPHLGRPCNLYSTCLENNHTATAQSVIR